MAFIGPTARAIGDPPVTGDPERGLRVDLNGTDESWVATNDAAQNFGSAFEVKRAKGAGQLFCLLRHYTQKRFRN